jgi:hypothetical protein
MKLSEADWDTYDTVYDACVTVCYIDEEDEAEDNYYKFCTNIIKKVEVEKQNGDILIVDWTKLIQDNMEKFKMFTKKHWRYAYEDDEDELIYQWINEIHSYLAGYVSEDFYGVLVKFVETLEA